MRGVANPGIGRIRKYQKLAAVKRPSAAAAIIMKAVLIAWKRV
jgi:hypothetical protein